MPIKIDGGLSAVNRLREEGIVTIGKDRAMTQDIRPLKILILNLMPLKKPTELQLLRLLGNSPIQIEIDFCRPVSRVSTHTDNSYLDRVYLEWNDIKDRYYDGFIITGAPVEKIDFEDVEYWPELVQYFEWARSHVFSVLHYCWGAQAGLYYYYNIPKIMLPKKLYGIYPYGLTTNFHPLLRGFDDRYFIPQSRYTRVDDNKIDADPRLEVLSRSAENGINICSTSDMRHIFVRAILNMTEIPCRMNSSVTKTRALTRSSRNFTIPTMTAVSSPASSGAAMLTCFTPIGSIWSIRKRPMTCCS